MPHYRKDLTSSSSSSNTFTSIVIAIATASAIGLGIYATSGQTANLLSFFDDSDVFMSGVGPQGQWVNPQYTNETWPDPTTNEGAQIYVNPDNVLAYSNGTNWINVNDGSVLLPPTSWAADVALQYDGVDEYVLGADIADYGLSNTGAFSIEMIIHIDMTRTETTYLWSFFDGTNKIESSWVNSRFNFDIASSVTNRVFASPTRANKAYHIVYVFDGTLAGNKDKAKIYVDGVDATAGDSGTIPTATPTMSTVNLYIGARAAPPSGIGSYFDEQIVQFTVFNRALSSSEVSDLYNSGSYSDPTLVSGCISSYWFGDNVLDDETVIKDNCGSNDITPNNFESSDYGAY